MLQILEYWTGYYKLQLYFYTLLSKGCSFMAKMDAFRSSTSRRFYSSTSSALCSVPASKTPVTNTYHWSLVVIENETQTQQTKYSVTGIFCSKLDLNTAGEKPSLSVFVKIFFCCARFSFVGLNRTRNFSISPLLLEYDVSQISVQLAEGRYTTLSNIISRVFQRWLIQNYKRCEIFAGINSELSQVSNKVRAL